MNISDYSYVSYFLLLSTEKVATNHFNFTIYKTRKYESLSERFTA